MKRQWENEKLIENWTFNAWDFAQLGNKIGATRLGFAVLLKFFQCQGRFPLFKNEADPVISFVTAQVGVHKSPGGASSRANLLDYENLQYILTRVINWDIIRNQYDEMIA